MNLNDLFAIAAERTPDKVALDFPSATWTYHQLFAGAEALAAKLAAQGLGKGDRVLFFLGNRPEFVIAYLAVIRLGAILVPVNLRYRRLELSHILADCTPRLIISEQAQLSILAESGIASAGTPILMAEQFGDLSGYDAGWHAPRVDGDDRAVIMYTSGTTGRSKGAMLTHNNLLATVTGLLAAWGWQQTDVLHLCLPLFHTHGLVVGMHCALAAGATIQLRAKFENQATLDELAAGGATLFFAVPTIYMRLVEELRTRAPVDLSHMRLFCSGSAPLAAETFAAFQALTGHTILERYGMTETGMNLSNPYAGPRLAGSVGTPLPGVMIRIVDADGREVAPGEEGELLLRGSNVFDGYWNAPEKTAESFSLDEAGRRWFHTGDLARQDPATGYVTLLGRRHELIISGGFNIYPREIEELLMAHPAIAEAAVIGMANAEWGEVPVAYVVCQTVVDDEELAAYCRGQLASFKVPRHFHRVTDLPRNAMGKLQKNLLKDA
jgi:malonyl-CoA/methylmalonyl-CoA synthetase